MTPVFGEKPPPAWLGLETRPYLLLVLTMSFWAGNAIVGRAVHPQITPLALTFWRWLTALVVYLPFAVGPMWAQRGLILREWKILVVFGVLSVPLYHLLMLTALANTTALSVSLVSSVMPVVIVAMSWGMFRERVSRRQGGGILLSLLGVAVLITRGDPELAASLRFQAGDLWALATVPVWGLYSVLLRHRPADLQPAALLGTIFLVGVAVLTPVYLANPAAAPRAVTWGVVGAAVYMGIFPAVLAYSFWNRAVELVGANRAGQFIHLVPLFATTMAISILGEHLRPYHGAGVALIAGGIYLATVVKPSPA